MSEPTKTEVTAEEWLKATTLELCKVADHFIALRKDAERVDAAAVELMDSTAKLEHENTALKARVNRLEASLLDYILASEQAKTECIFGKESKPCYHCLKTECECSDADVSPEMGDK